MKNAMLAFILSLSACICARANSIGLVPLHDFTGADGESSIGPLLADQSTAGVYYGTASSGGSAGEGTLFKVVVTGDRTAPSTTYTVLHNFDDGSVTNDGRTPMGRLVQDSSGNVYGIAYLSYAYTTPTYAGVVYKYNSSTGFQIIHRFADGSVTNDGRYPAGGLVIDSSGTLYGTTTEGGAHGQGTIFKLVQSGGVWTETVLYHFTGGSSDGGSPYAAMLMATDGKLYGTTQFGGANDSGTVFRFNLSTSTLNTICSPPADNGAFGNGVAQVPLANSGGLLQFFGVTYFGGTSGMGVVYSLTETYSGSGVFGYSVVHNFSGGTNDGNLGSGELLFYTNSTGSYFYGVTQYGGGNDEGTVYRIALNGNFLVLGTPWVIGQPVASLTVGSIGGTPVFMGTTLADGSYGNGYVYEVYLQ